MKTKRVVELTVEEIHALLQTAGHIGWIPPDLYVAFRSALKKLDAAGAEK